MMGRDALYVPAGTATACRSRTAWTEELGAEEGRDGPARRFAQRCRSYAEKFIERATRRNSGVSASSGIASYGRPEEETASEAPAAAAIYRTIDRTYEAEIIRQLGAFFTNGTPIYHGVKPVHWCYSCKTALAEAEVEYEERKRSVDLRQVPGTWCSSVA